jgi:hypothetical protein
MLTGWLSQATLLVLFTTRMQRDFQQLELIEPVINWLVLEDKNHFTLAQVLPM